MTQKKTIAALAAEDDIAAMYVSSMWACYASAAEDDIARDGIDVNSVPSCTLAAWRVLTKKKTPAERAPATKKAEPRCQTERLSLCSCKGSCSPSASVKMVKGRDIELFQLCANNDILECDVGGAVKAATVHKSS